MPAADLLTRPSAGPVPATYLGLLAGEWTPAMPSPLVRSRFLGLLYVLHDRADRLGHVRALPGGDLVQGLARSACLSLEDAARYLAAATAAGVVVRLDADTYALRPAAVPDWPAALDHITAHRPTRRTAP